MAAPPAVVYFLRLQSPARYWVALPAIILAPPAVACFLLGSHLPYWASHGDIVQACVFDRDDCSLAVATWGLVIFAATTFVTALVAAMFAGSAYFNEVKQVLGERICAEKDHEGAADVVLYLRRSGKITALLPPGVSRNSFSADRDHTFFNLGRAPIINISVRYALIFANRSKPVIGKIDLGSVQRDGEIHFTLYRQSGALTIETIEWTEARHGKDGKQTLEFHPQFRPERVESESRFP